MSKTFLFAAKLPTSWAVADMRSLPSTFLPEPSWFAEWGFRPRQLTIHASCLPVDCSHLRIVCAFSCRCWRDCTLSPGAALRGLSVLAGRYEEHDCTYDLQEFSGPLPSVTRLSLACLRPLWRQRAFPQLTSLDLVQAFAGPLRDFELPLLTSFDYFPRIEAAVLARLALCKQLQSVRFGVSSRALCIRACCSECCCAVCLFVRSAFQRRVPMPPALTPLPICALTMPVVSSLRPGQAHGGQRVAASAALAGRTGAADPRRPLQPARP